MERRYTVILSALAAVLLAGGLAGAAPARLSSLTDDRMRHPARVVVDAAGSVYAAQPVDNIIHVYNRDGKWTKSLSVSSPLGMAFDPSGNLYVCSRAKKAVLVFHPDLTPKAVLGEGQMVQPTSLAFDGSGRLYVTDSEKNSVLVFDATGALAFTFGSAGSGNGQFIKPLGIAVNDAAGEVYVSDQPIIQTANGPANGARIQVFGKDGVFKRSFGTYGDGAGQIARPMDLAVDRAGNLYIADSYQNVVHIFNPATGLKTGALSDPARPLSVPTGISISRNQAAYIASYKGASVELYALDGYTTLEVTPASLGFTSVQYGPDPAAQTIVIANSGSGTLGWTATADQAWITLGQAGGTTGPATSTGLSVGINASTLVPGTYSGTVTITADFGRTEKVGVTLTVLPPPMLTLGNGWLTFSAKQKTDPAPQTVTVEIANARTLSWAAFSDSPWLSITPSSGTATTGATVSIKSAPLAVGTYTGYLTFRAPGAIGDGSKITVTLTVLPSSKLTVTTNIAAAAFTVTGPAVYRGTGTSWSIDGAPAGSYTVTYDAVAGHRSPRPQTQTLGEAGDVVFTGTYQSYQDLAARRNIIAAPGPGPKNPALVKAYTNNGSSQVFELLALETAHGASVAAGDVDGDGSSEIIVGAGPGPENPALVRVYRPDRSLFAEFTALPGLAGVQVAAADLDGNGSAEIIVAPGGGDQNTGIVRVYAYDAEARAFVPTGIDMTAHGSGYGAVVAAGNIDGKGAAEIITAAGPGPKNPAHIRIWSVDTSGGPGNWTMKLLREISREGSYGATIAAGDIDGDGVDEIIVGAGPDPKAAGDVAILKADGTQLRTMRVFSGRYGVTVAAADLDGDGRAEIIAGAGPDPRTGKGDSTEPAIRVMSAAGAELCSLTPFTGSAYGVRVAVGELGLSGTAAVAGPATAVQETNSQARKKAL